MPNDSDPAGEPDNPTADAMPRWEQVVDDMAATAEEYRERGWDAHEIHPGDVAILTGDVDRTGIELLAPDNEFDPAVEAFDEAGGFDNAQVFRGDTAGTVYVVVALEDPDAETAVLFPAYFSPGEHEEFVEMVEEEGEVRTHIRPLDERRVLTFTHEDPSLFLSEQ
ncbi:DUF7529 family protein [Halobacterium wangiae]|uniref:DUF7529 family protein n=1 Tax=Halobacterium wangiae TaxID=2902623 RepID=UPI001E566820|nr:hypothetical protein [Halobacterium wangiae]